ncbi:MAG: L-threonylcarbamoyladenylate synthase [Candidatus Omnitrophica bacterium]|nr:L-threonylcarbamoyladenylate synthase [Candidatus Omnitrophota bacterium]
MKPLILKIDPLDIDQGAIRKAADVINNRGLVAFPTETVYGLGANALDSRAVAGIFEAKKRPLDDPLIVHIFGREDLEKLVKTVPREVEKLIDRFWPGALTIILPRSSIVPDIVTGGIDTVAVRMPSGRIARKLIEMSGVPIAAPSANLFGRPSPTMAEHVVKDLGRSVDLVLDGGETEIGVESTVIEFSGKKIVVLRPGGVSGEELRAFSSETEVLSENEVSRRSPGKYPRHYSPRGEVKIAGLGEGQREKLISMAREEASSGKKVGILAAAENEDRLEDIPYKVLGSAKDPKACASRLFRALREFDSESFDVIIAEAIPEEGLGLAVMNRLRKAAGSS